MMSLNNSFCSLYRKNVSFEDENSPEDGYSEKFQQEEKKPPLSLATHVSAVVSEQQKIYNIFI